MRVFSFRPAAVAAMAVAVAALAPRTAQAQIINFQGSTLGCFGAGCTPAATSSDATGLVTFYNNSFNVSAPSPGFAALNDGHSLGYVSVGTASGTAVNSPFTMLVNFTVPSAVNTTFQALVYGKVFTTGVGGVQFDFSPPAGSPTDATNGPFTFTDPTTGKTGTFTLTAFGDPYTSGTGSRLGSCAGGICPGADLRGRIDVSSLTPEPASLILLGSGLMGLVGVGGVRRRKLLA